ncbi:MAG: hypothetical protein BEN19_06580 [Epulopiscium sp. Nuni2H_MBin003]|nr:MAG: hypothetical protein BEN19_06580 [Epulopiscium sp. Nuni2H_MBin003]
MFDLENINKYISYELLLEECTIYNHDEHVLNKYYQGEIYLIHPTYNIMHSNDLDLISKYAPIDRYNQYIEARENPKIVHYIGEFKPWHYPQYNPCAHYYWNTIRGTELYDLAIQSQIENIQKNYSRKVFIDDIINY